MKSTTKTVLIIAALLVLCLACLCLLIAGGAYIFSSNFLSSSTPFWETPIILNDETPTPFVNPGTLTPFVDPGIQILDPTQLEQASETLRELNESTVPINDPIDLAARLGGYGNKLLGKCQLHI